MRPVLRPTPNPSQDDFSEFSLLRGGLFEIIQRHLHPLGISFGIGHRLVAFVLLAWIPIGILEFLSWLIRDGARTEKIFIVDLGMNIRILFAGILLIAAEWPIDYRVKAALQQLRSRGIIREDQSLSIILSRASKWLTGPRVILFEGILLIFVFLDTFVGFHPLDPRTDWSAFAFRQDNPPPAVLWYLWVSLPLLRFLRIRWTWRMLVWIKILWDISRLPLHLSPTHVDQKGGLAILARAQQSFAILWISVSALSAATIPHAITTKDRPLEAFYLPIGFLLILEVILTLFPLSFFFHTLDRVKKRGLVDYEFLSSRFSFDFDGRWMLDHSQSDRISKEPDFSALSDLGTAYDRIKGMEIFLIDRQSIVKIAIAGALPFLPLSLFKVPMDQLLKIFLRLVS